MMNSLRKEFNSRIRNSYLNENNICECEKCKKHKSKSSLHVHHIIPLGDGGTNDYNNLIALCTRCHDEWHSVEGLSLFTFDEWLNFPPYIVLVNSFYKITELRGNLSPTRIKRMLEIDFNLYKVVGCSRETEIRDNRRRRGIQAKINSELNNYGRPKALDFKEFCEEYIKVVDGYLTPSECMKNLGMSKATFYRYAKEYKNKALTFSGQVL